MIFPMYVLFFSSNVEADSSTATSIIVLLHIYYSLHVHLLKYTIRTAYSFLFHQFISVSKHFQIIRVFVSHAAVVGAASVAAVAAMSAVAKLIKLF